MTFGVNHLGHFALVQGLLDDLAHPARIVVVSSGTHDPAKFTGMPSPKYTTRRATRAPASPTPPTAAAGTPRPSCAMCSSPTNSTAGWARGAAVSPSTPSIPVSCRVRVSPATTRRSGDGHGATCSRCCASFRTSTAPGLPVRASRRWSSDPGFDGVTGAYFEGKRPIRSSADSYDREQGARPVGDQRAARDAGNLERLNTTISAAKPAVAQPSRTTSALGFGHDAARPSAPQPDDQHRQRGPDDRQHRPPDVEGPLAEQRERSRDEKANALRSQDNWVRSA